MSSPQGRRRGSYSHDRERKYRRRSGRGDSLDRRNYHRSDSRDDDGNRRRYDRRSSRRVESRSPSIRNKRRNERGPQRGTNDEDYHTDSTVTEQSRIRRRQSRISRWRRDRRYTPRRVRHSNRYPPRRRRVNRRRRKTYRWETTESDSSVTLSEYDSSETDIGWRQWRRRYAELESPFLYRVGEWVEFRFQTGHGAKWLAAVIKKVNRAMYGEYTYSVYLPSLGEWRSFVSADELRDRSITDYDLLKEEKEIRLFKGADRRNANGWMNNYTLPDILPKEEYDLLSRGRSTNRVQGVQNVTRLRTKSANGRFDPTREEVGNKQRATSQPPARLTWPKLLAEFAYHYKNSINYAPELYGQDCKDEKVLNGKDECDDNELRIDDSPGLTTIESHDINLEEYTQDVEQHNGSHVNVFQGAYHTDGVNEHDVAKASQLENLVKISPEINIFMADNAVTLHIDPRRETLRVDR